MGWLRRNVDEIAADPVLRVYGALLAATHVLAFLSWQRAPMALLLDRHSTPICWPFFESCGDYRVLSATGVEVMLWAYLGAAVVTLALFVPRRLAGLAYAALILLTLFKAAIWLQDYRLRLNQHYMALWVSLAYLFLPAKRRVLRYLVVAFYVWAGTLKLDREWLSGAALYERPLLVPGSLIPAACAYVVVLELVVIWGLFARRAWLFWAALAQLVLFHVASFPVVGFFYPTLMFALLAIFPLARRWPAAGDEPSPRRLVARGGEPWSTRVLLAGFCALQCLPWAFPGDSALTGEGRLFALHMFDARVECTATATLHRRGGRPARLELHGSLPARTRCDPIVYLSVGKALCRRFGGEPGFSDLDLALRSRRTTEPELRPVIDVRRFCSAGLSYDLWRHNPWILRP